MYVLVEMDTWESDQEFVFLNDEVFDTLDAAIKGAKVTSSPSADDRVKWEIYELVHTGIEIEATPDDFE